MDRIAVVGGDGIGPEGIGCTVDVLAEAQRSASGFELDSLATRDGAGTSFEIGDALPAKAPATCRAADAILLGACGLTGARYPDGTEIIPQDTLWIVLDRYAGIRPARQLASVPSPPGAPAADRLRPGPREHRRDLRLARRGYRARCSGHDRRRIRS